MPTERRLIRASLVNADPLMRSLGRPNREQVVTTRPDQLTTLQALDLSNGQILDRPARARGGERAEDAPEGTTSVDRGRLPACAVPSRRTPAELATARALLGIAVTTDGVADLLWVVLMLPEFQLIR